jgi:hypothetical protein
MKQDTPSNVVTLTETDATHKFYGGSFVVNRGAILRGFIRKERYYNNKWTIGSKVAFTRANTFDSFDANKKTLHEYIKFLIEKKWLIYEFDTLIELMTWVSESVEE